MTERAAYRIRDFCHAYGVGPTTTYALIKDGKLRSVKVGTRTLIPRESAEAWFASLQTSPQLKSEFERAPANGRERPRRKKSLRVYTVTERLRRMAGDHE